MPGRQLSKPHTSSLPYQNRLLLAFCFLLLAILLCFPETALPLVRESILIWYQSLLPTLFPAMILSNIILYLFLNLKQYRFRIPVLSSLYHLDSYGCLVLLLGFLCGFPIGAYLCAKLVRERRLTREQGQYLLGFCNNLSPVFVISVYCRLFPAVPKIPALLLFYGCPLLYGILLYPCTFRQRRYFRLRHNSRHCRNFEDSQNSRHSLKNENPEPEKTLSEASPSGTPERSITDLIDYGISDALSSIVRLAGYIVFFRLFLLPLRLLEPEGSYSLLLGSLIEITSGIQTYSQNAAATELNEILCHTLPFMTFGGICCIGQTICMIRDSGLSILTYVRDKLLQGVLLIVLLKLSLPFFG